MSVAQLVGAFAASLMLWALIVLAFIVPASA